MDSLPSGTLACVYRAVNEGKTVINGTDLAEFLALFLATLGFLQLTIGGVKRYFVYIKKGLEPRDIKYLKKFLDIDTGMKFIR